MGLSKFGIGLKMENDYEEFEVASGDSDLELGPGGVAEKDDEEEVVELKPFATIKRPLSQGIYPRSLGLIFNLHILNFGV